MTETDDIISITSPLCEMIEERNHATPCDYTSLYSPDTSSAPLPLGRMGVHGVHKDPDQYHPNLPPKQAKKQTKMKMKMKSKVIIFAPKEWRGALRFTAPAGTPAAIGRDRISNSAAVGAIVDHSGHSGEVIGELPSNKENKENCYPSINQSINLHADNLSPGGVTHILNFLRDRVPGNKRISIQQRGGRSNNQSNKNSNSKGASLLHRRSLAIDLNHNTQDPVDQVYGQEKRELFSSPLNPLYKTLSVSNDKSNNDVHEPRVAISRMK